MLTFYSAYALITGGNGGIGYGIALSLVKNGFGVILLGRNGSKLSTAAKELRKEVRLPVGASAADQDTYVKTIVLDPQTATPEQISAKINQEIIIQGLRVTILVNNVGTVPIAYPPYRDLATYSSDDLDNTINLNSRFMAHLTTQFVPLLTNNKQPGTERRSLILNISSGADVGLPYQVLYASTKAFVTSFSKGLSRELQSSEKTKHVDVLAVIAGDVKSQGNIAGLLRDTPDSETYGRLIVERTDKAIKRRWRQMTPYWSHHLNFIILSILPDTMVSSGILDIMLKKKIAMNEAMKPK